ncbi:MAG: NADH:ubiquinone oxidoreductase, partial [Tremellales sp. Tagirdzhanova-0007]
MAFRQVARSTRPLTTSFRSTIPSRAPQYISRNLPAFLPSSSFSSSARRRDEVRPENVSTKQLPKGAEVIVPKVSANLFAAGPSNDLLPQKKPYVLTRWRRFLQNFGRVTLVVLLAATGTFVYITQKDAYPGDQLPTDSSKPTLVVLGSGWGATSFLKNLDTEEFNVVVISPRNYFLFSPLLPSVTVGTLEPRSIIQPTRYITRHKKRRVAVYEAEARAVDPVKKTVTFTDLSDVRPDADSVTIPYDYLVYAVGCENQTFGIKGVNDHACFLKELSDADKIRTKLLDCVESAAFKDQPDEEVERLMHMVVVGGGPTGVEYAGELHDFLIDDLRKWYPEISGRLRITLIEALPNVLPAFSKQLIQYTESTFKENKIDVLTRTMVKDVKEKS